MMFAHGRYATNSESSLRAGRCQDRIVSLEGQKGRFEFTNKRAADAAVNAVTDAAANDVAMKAADAFTAAVQY